jgi:hypothetical protein
MISLTNHKSNSNRQFTKDMKELKEDAQLE